jgi:phage head maturation protease
MIQEKRFLCEARIIVEGAEGKAGSIEATVTTFNARVGADGRRFHYQPEGFRDWAAVFAHEGKPLPMFLNHQSDAIPIGEWTNFLMDESSMTATGRIYMNTTAGKDIYTVMQESPQMFGGVSVGAYAEECQTVDFDGQVVDDNDPEGYFQITKGGLREVSIVMYPNNPEANVKKLEFFRADGSADLKILELALRDAGLSKSDAVAAASTFKKVFEQRDAVLVPLENATPQSDSDVEATEAEILIALEQREFLKTLANRLKGSLHVQGNY